MISIGMDPNMLEIGSFVLTWHGFFAFLGVVVALLIVNSFAKKNGIDPDMVQSTAVWVIICGIIGARAFHVIDRWDFYEDNLGQILLIWGGGIALFGSIIGGVIGGSIYAYIKGYPIGVLADLAAPALLVGQTVGRIGDIINGEHVSNLTNFTWGFIYSHPDSLSNKVHGLNASHPAILYEMIWNLFVLGIVWFLRDRIKPNGMLLALSLCMYSFGRFFIQFVRQDKIWFAGLQEAHLIAIAIIAITLPLLVYRAQITLKR